MSDKALTTLDAAIANGNATAAMQLVRQLGVLRPAAPGSTDPELLAGRRDLALRRRKLRQQDQADEIAQLKRDRQRKEEEQYTVKRCTDVISFFRAQREIALIREAAKSGKSPAEIRKAFEEREARDWEWAQQRARSEAEKLAKSSGAQTTPLPATPPASAQTSSPSSPPALAAPATSSAPPPDANATAIVKTQVARVSPTSPQRTRKVPRPDTEPDDDGPWVRYS